MSLEQKNIKHDTNKTEENSKIIIPDISKSILVKKYNKMIKDARDERDKLERLSED
jgi:hypothetical protein